ncbi:hypothetical protein MMC25_001240 [Agyrium rufum]|nr:hypothetical protein [Agyrium rufum]
MSDVNAREDGARKRRRLPLSCRTCKARKLKCDRELPCTRCVKSYRANSCVYDSRAVSTHPDNDYRHDRVSSGQGQGIETPRSLEHPNTALPNRPNQAPLQEYPGYDAQQRRITELESQVLDLQNSLTRKEYSSFTAGSGDSASKVLPHVRGSWSAFPEQDHQRAERVLLRGRDFKTKYYGSSHPSSVLRQFTELSRFMKDIVSRYPIIERVEDDLESMKKHILNRQITTKIDGTFLLALLPVRSIVDQIIETYLANFETTYRVLHVPSFRISYAEFWADPQASPEDSVVIILLLMSIAHCLPHGKESVFESSSSARRNEVIDWIQLCEEWSRQQTQKRLTLATFQIQILLFMAKRMNTIKKKRTWTVAGYLLRFTMAAGLHRDPSVIQKQTSAFDKEMRRRIWATVLELELQACLDRGMPASLEEGHWDCPPPANLHDEDLDPLAEELPPSLPTDRYTASSFLHLAYRSIQLRVYLTSLQSKIGDSLPYDQVLLLDERIMQSLSEIPNWQESDRNPITSLSSVLPQAMLKIQLHQYLPLIHRPFAHAGHPRYFYSQAAHLNSGFCVLEDFVAIQRSGNFSLALMREDVIRAALNVCHDIVQSSRQHKQAPSTSSTIRFQSYLHLLREATDILETKVLCLGQGTRTHFLMCATYALVQTVIAPENVMEYQQVAADRTIKLHYRMLAQQKHTSSIGVQGAPSNSSASIEALLNPQEEPFTMPEPVDGTTFLLDAITDTDFFGFNMDGFWDL